MRKWNVGFNGVTPRCWNGRKHRTSHRPCPHDCPPPLIASLGGNLVISSKIGLTGQLSVPSRLLRPEFFDWFGFCHRFALEVSGSVFGPLPVPTDRRTRWKAPVSLAPLTKANRLRRRGAKLRIRQHHGKSSCSRCIRIAGLPWEMMSFEFTRNKNQGVSDESRRRGCLIYAIRVSSARI